MFWKNKIAVLIGILCKVLSEIIKNTTGESKKKATGLHHC